MTSEEAIEFLRSSARRGGFSFVPEINAHNAKVDEAIALLRSPAPGAVAMRKAIALLRSASQQSHAAHFDKTGGSGTGCPECIRARELREKADAILRDIPTQKEAK